MKCLSKIASNACQVIRRV